MVASFTSGTNFDVVYVRDSFLAEWAAAGWIVPLTGLPKVDEYMVDLPQGIIEQMSIIFLTKLFPMNFTPWVYYKKTGEPDPIR